MKKNWIYILIGTVTLIVFTRYIIFSKNNDPYYIMKIDYFELISVNLNDNELKILNTKAPSETMTFILGNIYPREEIKKLKKGDILFKDHESYKLIVKRKNKVVFKINHE